MDDPRDIMKAAGVECPEVETLLVDSVPDAKPIADEYLSAQVLFRDLDAAILALARLVAKYKWIAEHYRGWDFSGPDKVGDRRAQSMRNEGDDEVEWLERRWEEHREDLDP